MFPHAGGAAGFFRDYSAALSARTRVFCVQYPGRQDRFHEQPVNTIEELAEGVFDEVRTLTGRPLAFFGHSMGALVAFEVAIRLEQRTGGGLFRFFVSGRRAPSCPPPDKPLTFSDAYLVAELHRSGISDAHLLADPDLLRFVLPAMRGDYQAATTYHCSTARRISCPITIFVGAEDPKCTVREAGAWTRHTVAECDLRIFRGGDHFYLVPRAADVIQMIDDHLGH